ncbi:MAG: ferrous iron transport protein A [Methanosarcinales archaeon]|jgi:ferrous iron transport protein A|nr:ferrous iron transport protein A [Methanosarcinales archaeon]
MIPLNDMKPETESIISKITIDEIIYRRLEMLGIRIGNKIKNVTSQPFGGPIVIEVNRTQISIGTGIAEKIFVEKITNV